MNNSPLIIAHRGASYYAPENTMAAVKLAWEQDTDALEVDVHKSRDDHIIVIHDPDTFRTTRIKKIIRDENLKDIQKLDAGSWKDQNTTTNIYRNLERFWPLFPQTKKCASR